MTSPRFTFRLQQVLEIRERVEQAAAARMAVASERAQAAREAHDALAAVRAAGAEEIQRAHAHAPTVGQLSNLAFVLDRLDAQLSESHGIVQDADAGVEQAQDALQLAYQARRVIDRLRERQHEEWRIDVSQADRLLMDELALARFATRAPSDSVEDDR
ncbi:MAG TPA: flagellar export protein FliJ [Gemmatimonadaceae bacterium]|nr:flagellar export protein FliJ [Gemmatimonadaceae bacterium]